MLRGLWPWLRRRRWWVLACSAVLLPVCYVLSLGPAVCLVDRDILPQKLGEALYAPLIFVYERNWLEAVGLQKALEKYVEWWSEL